MAGRRPRIGAPSPRGAALLATGPVAFLAIFFGWPLVEILRRGLSAGGVRDAVADPGIRHIAWFTLWQAVVSTVVTLVAGLPLASVLALVTVPFVLPTVVVGAAFLALLPERWHGTTAAIVLAHAFFNLAVVVRTVGAMWQHLDPTLEDSARVLGASRWRAFVHVTLPLLRPAILAAASVVFLFTFTSFGVVLLLGGPRLRTLDVEIYRLTAQLLDLRAAAAVATMQLVFLAVLLWWWSRAQARHALALRLRPSSALPRPRGARQRAWVAGNVAVAVVLLSIPLARLVQRSFQVGDGYGLDWWRALGHRTSLAVPAIDSIGVSLRYAAVATVLATVFGALAATAIAPGGPLAGLLDTGLMLPLGTSAVTVGFGLLVTLDTGWYDLRGSWVLVPIAQAIVGLPFVVRASLPVLRSIDPRQRDAAAVLGASPTRVWWAVDRPVLARALTVGASFAFAVSMGEFGATAFRVRRGAPTVPVAVAQLLGRPGASNAGQAYALSVVLAIAVAVAVLAVEHVRGDRGGIF